MRGRAAALHLGAIAVLTMLSQLGGLAWAGAMLVSRRKGLRMQGFLLVFGLFYGLIWGAAQVTAPAFGRVPLPCSGAPLRMQSPLYCALMRNFVTPELRDVAMDAAHAVAAEHPGTITLALDGSLPFLDGLPLFPHLSHDDGEKLDFAFFYADATGYAPGQTASPLGYFAFERAGAEQCPPAFPTLRWDMGWFQPLVRKDLTLERDRTATLIRVLMQDPRVAKIFVEPPLASALGLSGDKLRFQGCRAARHDDHIHIQL
jgi:hypothetical protein